MSVGALVLTMLGALYGGIVLGANIQCVIHQVPRRRRWVILLWPLAIPFAPSWFVFCGLSQTPASLPMIWARRSLPRKALGVVSVYCATIVNLPGILGFAAQALAQAQPLRAGMFLRYLTALPRNDPAHRSGWRF